jgi:hypothetical protein
MRWVFVSPSTTDAGARTALIGRVVGGMSFAFMR